MTEDRRKLPTTVGIRWTARTVAPQRLTITNESCRKRAALLKPVSRVRIPPGGTKLRCWSEADSEPRWKARNPAVPQHSSSLASASPPRNSLAARRRAELLSRHRSGTGSSEQAESGRSYHIHEPSVQRANSAHGRHRHHRLRAAIGGRLYAVWLGSGVGRESHAPTSRPTVTQSKQSPRLVSGSIEPDL
jgi:hypothetical protein